MSAIKCRFCGEMLNGLRPGDRLGAVGNVGHSKEAKQQDRRPSKSNGLTLRTVLGLAVLTGVVYVLYKVTTGSSVRTAISGPEVISDETAILDEGEARAYSFSFANDRRVRLSLHARPRRVNVRLMTESDYAEYERARGSLLGGKYRYVPALSTDGVTDFEQEAMVPAGRYTIVIERPRDSILFTDKTSAHVVIKGM
ncbi:MAG: hypothetical protein KIT31_32960 [Deltaproteobacteria bacterium]|nr:hypothetical protein [Deltaproteobacteria bacterium]